MPRSLSAPEAATHAGTDSGPSRRVQKKKANSDPRKPPKGLTAAC